MAEINFRKVCKRKIGFPSDSLDEYARGVKRFIKKWRINQVRSKESALKVILDCNLADTTQEATEVLDHLANPKERVYLHWFGEDGYIVEKNDNQEYRMKKYECMFASF